MWRPGVATGRSPHFSGQSRQKTPRLQRAEPPGGHDDSIWTAAPWLSNLERRPIQRPPVSSRSISISSTHLMLSMCVRQWIQDAMWQPSWSRSRGISTRWQGYESSLHVGAKEPYISSAEAVKFYAVALGLRVSTWSAAQPKNSPREPDVPGKGWVKTGWHWPHRPGHNCQGYQ